MVALMLIGPAPGPAPKPPVPPVEGGAAPGLPHIVYLTSIDGRLPADSVDARAFVSALRAAFDADHYLTEGVGGGPARAFPALANRFQLVQGDAFGDEWQVRVTIMKWFGGAGDSLRDGRSGPPRPSGGDSTGTRAPKPEGGFPDSVWGLRVNVAVLSPEAAAMGARPLPVREDLTLRVPLEPRPTWFSHAGRMVGLLGVEELHHQSGILASDLRLRLDRTVRKSVIARSPPAPNR